MPKLSIKDVELASAAKRANQRLRELEKQGLTNAPAYSYIERARFRQDPALGETRHGEVKFRTDIAHMSAEEKSNLRNMIKGFLNAETSTAKGAKAVAKRVKAGYAAGNAEIAEALTDNDYLSVWSTAISKEWSRQYGSDFTKQVIDAMGTDKKSAEEIEDFLKGNLSEPVTEIVEAVDDERLASGNGSKWEWEAIYT